MHKTLNTCSSSYQSICVIKANINNNTNNNNTNTNTTTNNNNNKKILPT